jgi:hypothetical protein
MKYVQNFRCKYIWEDNFNMDATEIGYKDWDWIHLAWDRVQCQVLVSLQFP